jgi:PAS domain S-box-containing protein
MKCESNIDNVANSLVEKYIRPGSESEVNVSNQVRDQILVQLRASRKGNTDFEENIKDSFYQAQNEIIIILAMDALPRYLQSDIFKGWREMEVQNGYCAVNLIQEIEARSSMKHLHDSLNSIKLDPTRNHSTAFIQRAFATLDPIEIPRIAKSCYLSTFLGSVEGLPISVSLSSASKDRKGFPLIYVNSVFEEVTGYPRNDIIGRNCRFLQAGKAEADKISALAKALREAKPIKIEITNYRKNGEEFRNLLAMKPIFNYKGEYSFIIGLQFDVSGQSSTVSKLQLIDHLVSMLPDRLPKNDEYSPLYEPYHF